jgi:hypothetical protein
MAYRQPFIYLYGGFDGTNSLGDMYRFHTETELWQAISGPGTSLFLEPTSSSVSLAPTETDIVDSDGEQDHIVGPGQQSAHVANAGVAAMTLGSLPRWGAASCLIGSDLFVLGGLAERRKQRDAEDVDDDDDDDDDDNPFSQDGGGATYKLTSRGIRFRMEGWSLKLLAAMYIAKNFPQLLTAPDPLSYY